MKQVNSNPTFFGMFPEVERSTEWVTQRIRTGRYTCQSTMIVYGTRRGQGPLDETVTIGVGHVRWTLTGPNTNEGQCVYSVFMAERYWSLVIGDW